MKKTANKRKRVQMPAGIRNKMMAAVSMLMVSSIMLVSSTYAWFTLSTAPEVTGITTNVGANGNLEMMLLTGNDEDLNPGSYYSEADDLGVASKVGDSIAATGDVATSNVTWGNLVDLNSSEYGLDNVVLAPARLNVTKAKAEGMANTIGSTILNAPSYGSDGRVVDVNTATYTGRANGDTFAYDEAHKGVRVIGTTTDVSQRLAEYRTAKGAVTSNANTAKNLATASLLNNGQNLANILVGYATNPATTYTNADLKTLKNVVTSLEAANESAAAAMKSVVLAYSLSGANTAELTDTDVTNLRTAIEGVTSITGTDSFSSIPNVVIPTGLDAAIATYKATAAKIDASLNTLTDLNGNIDNSVDTEGKYTYDQLLPVLNNTVNRSEVEIAGKKDLSKDDISFVVEEFTAKGSITMTMLSGSGVYADIAKLVGNYTVSGLKVSVTYSGTNFNVPVTMKTNVSGTGIPQVTTISVGEAPAESGQAANSTLSNTYGYALDLGFRTNAASSDLQLQTAAVNRVYTDQTGTEEEPISTQGSGSFMQFASSDVSNFSAEEVLALMSAIRVAFVSPNGIGGDILAIGALDITATTDQTTGITSYTAGETTKPVASDGAEVSNVATAAGYKAGLFLHDYTINENGIIVLGDKKADESAITALTQNKASKITVIVYLDGDLVDNTMVANGTTSMTGLMNIQFSSSATLAPMENTGMRDGGSGMGEITYTEKATAGQTITYGNYTGTVNDGVTIYEGSNGLKYFSTDGGTTKTKLTMNNYTAAITVTVTEPEPEAGTDTPVEEPENSGDTTVTDPEAGTGEGTETGSEGETTTPTA